MSTETKASAMPPEDASSQSDLPPYMQSRFLAALASWKNTEPLDHTNWVAWKGQMVSMMRHHRVWGHCDGTTSPPAMNEPKALEKWDTIKKVAKLLISGNIKSMEFVHISRAVTAKQKTT